MRLPWMCLSRTEMSHAEPGVLPVVNTGSCRLPRAAAVSADGAVAGVGHLGQPRHRVIPERLVDRGQVVRRVQRAERDGDAVAFVVLGAHLSPAGRAEPALGLADE